MTDLTPGALADLRRTFNDDALERLVRSDMAYYSTHGHYVPALARLLLAEKAEALAAIDAERAHNRNLEAERKHYKDWPDVADGMVEHSPVDTYRCENEDCPSEYEVWQFRPDDHDLDETCVLCPACGEEGKLFFRRFRGKPRAACLDAGEDTTT